ncbi:MAG: pilus assembly protein PilM [Verrucomicrobiota bacterium]|nr:pilus assembly protein PilM [Verrucomicrobiota bacterium]
MMRRSQKRCGLECGGSGAKLARLSRNADAFIVDEVTVEEEPFETRLQRQARTPLELVLQLLVREDLAGHRAVLTVEGAAGACFVILPRMNRKDADGALRLQARKFLAWETPESVMAHLDSEYPRNRVGSVVALARWDAMRPWCRLVERSGAVLEDVTARVCAYQALARAQRWAEQSSVFLVADIGAVTTSLVVFDRYQPRFMRDIPVAGDAISKALMTELSTDEGAIRLDETRAEQLKITGDIRAALASKHPGIPPVQGPERAETPRPAPPDPAKIAGKIGMLVRPIFERIAAEIARSVRLYRENTGQNVTAVYLAGGSSRLQALADHIAAAVSVPVRQVDPFAGIGFRSASVEETARRLGPRLAVAVGLALSDAPALSLLPASLRLSKQLAQFAAGAVLLLLIAGFLPLVAAGTTTRIRARAVRPEVEVASRRLLEMRALQQDLANLQGRLGEADHQLTSLRQATGRDPLWAGVLNSLAAAVPPDIVLTRVCANPAAAAARNVVIQGKVLTTSTAFDTTFAGLVSALSSSVFFSRVSIIAAEAKPTPGALGTFQIHCDLTC